MTKPITSAPGALVLVGLYVVELCALAFALALHRQGDRPLGAFLTAPAGLVWLAALLGLVVSLLVVAHLVRRLPPPRVRPLAVPVVLNLVSVAVLAGATEALVRALVTPTIQGPVVARTVLLPHRWEEVAARGRATLERAARERSLLVYDSELGWTNGPSRASTDYNREGVEEYLARLGQAPARPASPPREERIYVSSVEGLRSPRPDVAFAALAARRRIAVVGDSFTFGLEVPYEATWAYQLEQALGPEFQVLNFGVDGYGLDQAYLRYRRDVLGWQPEVVVLGVIDDDIRRTMCVYGFLCFPGFGLPFGKPRLVVTGDGLAPVNLPLPAPETLFARRTIAELPFLEFDVSYVPADWRWRPYHRSYAARLALSRYRAWSTAGPAVTAEAARSLNAEIVRAFVRLARERGSSPIVAYLPSRPTPGPARASSLARDALAASRVRYLDLTRCVEAVAAAERFVALHYSPRANAAVAGCLREAIAVGFESGYEGGVRKTSSISTW